MKTLLRVTQKQVTSKNLNMAMEDVEKDVIPVYSNKKESFLGFPESFPWEYGGKNINYYYQHLEIIIYLQEEQLINYQKYTQMISLILII